MKEERGDRDGLLRALMGTFRKDSWEQGKCAEGGEQVVNTHEPVWRPGREEGRWAAGWRSENRVDYLILARGLSLKPDSSAVGCGCNVAVKARGECYL